MLFEIIQVFLSRRATRIWIFLAHKWFIALLNQIQILHLQSWLTSLKQCGVGEFLWFAYWILLDCIDYNKFYWKPHGIRLNYEYVDMFAINWTGTWWKTSLILSEKLETLMFYFNLHQCKDWKLHSATFLKSQRRDYIP